MKFIKSELGGVMIQVMLVGGILAGLAPYIIKSGLLKGQMSVDERQNLVIEETVNNIRGILASADQCKDAMDAGWVTGINGYNEGDTLNNQVNVRLFDISPPSFSASGDGNLFLTFSKDVKTGSVSGSKNVRRKIPIKRFDKDGATYCISYDSTGVIDSYSHFCSQFGGTWDSATLTCDLSTLSPEFLENVIYPYGCQVLGANLSGSAATGWRCDGVAINGDLTAPHFDNSKIDLTAVVAGATRTDFQNTTCTGTEVADSVNTNSSVSCSEITCPQPSTSTYKAVYMAGVNQIQCQCQRDSTVEKQQFACGATDPNSCVDYVVNDGCGTGHVCEIKQGLTCTGNEACINGSCVCQPNCAPCVGATSACSDGCGGTCPIISTCTPDCSCASSTPVGQSCGDGCGGNCSGTSCSHMDSFSLIGTAQSNKEWASGIQICREVNYSNSGNSCIQTGQTDTEAGLCKKFQANTCSGTTAPVIQNVPDGTVCGTASVCQSGSCKKLIDLEGIGWKMTQNFATYTNCGSGEVGTGMCSSGEHYDCKDGGVNKSHGIYCSRLKGAVKVDTSASISIKGGRRTVVTCPSGYVVQSNCASGKPFRCEGGGTDSHRIKCVKLDFAGYSLKESHRYIYKRVGRGQAAKTYGVRCDSGEFLTGLCSTGRDQADCSGNRYILRCTKYE